MNKHFKNYEIVLVSKNTEDVKWVLNALKRSELNNELIWLKDDDRTFDYINCNGLYAGKTLSGYTKVFIIDSNFPGAASIKDQIASSDRFKGCEVLTLAESKEEFIRKNERNAFDLVNELFGKLQLLSFSLFL